jgi:hypothetical protein
MRYRFSNILRRTFLDRAAGAAAIASVAAPFVVRAQVAARA